MKLHLPKLLLTAVLAACVAPATWGATTYNLLDSDFGWNFGGTTYNAVTDSISASSWGPKTATYSSDRLYYTVDEKGEMSFTLTYTLSGTNGNDSTVTGDSVQIFAFVDSDKSIAIGTDDYKGTNPITWTNYIGYGVFESNTPISSGKLDLTHFSKDGVDAQRTNPGTYTITGNITAADSGYQLALTLTMGDNTYTSQTIDLGDTIDINKFVFTSDGYDRSLKALTITGSVLYSEYASTISGDTAAADAAWLKAGTDVEYSTISMTDGTAFIGLTGEGEGAAITFENGTKLAALEILGGSVTVKGAGELTADELLVHGGVATIGSDMTVTSKIEGSLVVADGANLSVDMYDLSFLATTTGTGTVLVDKNAILGAENSNTSTSAFAGTIKVTGGTLYLNEEKEANNKHAINFADATIELAGGNADYFGGTGTLGGIKVTQDAELCFFEGHGEVAVGTVEVASGKTFTIGMSRSGKNAWGMDLSIGAFTGTGGLSVGCDGFEVKATRTINIGSVGTAETAFGTISNGANHTMNLGNASTSLLNMGNVTNSGTLNIHGNLAGNSNISGGTISVKDGSSVTGNVTFGSAVALNGTLTNSGTLTINGALSGKATINLNGGTLNLNKALTDGVDISTSKAGTIKIGDEVTLNDADVLGTEKSTINGGATAVYDMGNGNTAAPKVALGTDWQGTVVVTNAFLDGIRLANYGKAGSTIRLVGVNGWIDFFGNNPNKFESDLELINYTGDTTKSAFIISDSSNGNVEFKGAISGNGDFQLASKQAESSSTTFTFSGDTSQWKGGIKVTAPYDNTSSIAPTWTIQLTGGGDIFNAGTNGGITENRGGTTNIEIGNASKSSIMNGAIDMQNSSATLNLKVKGDTTFKKDVEVSSLTVDSSKTATIEAAATTRTLTTNGTVEVKGTGSLTYGGTTKVEALTAQTLATETTGATITANAITGGKVTFSGDTPVTEARTISGSDVTNNAAAQATITLGAQNISLYAANGNIAATATQGAEIGTVNIGAGKTVSVYSAPDTTGTVTTSELTAGAGSILDANLVLNTGAALTLGEGGLNMNNSALTLGSSLTLNTETMQRIMALTEGKVVELFTNVSSLTLGEYTYSAGQLTADNGVDISKIFDLSTLTMPATIIANTGYYLGYNSSGQVYVGQIVPEPTTATLSLLALAALAARRRRK